MLEKSRFSVLVLFPRRVSQAVTLCLAPALSLGVRRVMGAGAAPRRPSPGSLTRMALAGLVGAVAVFVADLVGWLATDGSATGALLSGVPVGLAFSALFGASCGGIVGLAALAAAQPGPLARWTTLPVARAADSLLSLVAGLCAAGAVLAAAVPARESLVEWPRVCALVDAVALLVAFGAFVGAAALVRRLRSRTRRTWRPVGAALVLAGAAVCAGAAPPLPPAGTTAALWAAQVIRMAKDWKVPTSSSAESRTVISQVPRACCPSRPRSVRPSESRKVLSRLLRAPPRKRCRVATVPPGDRSWTKRSPR